jgi:hypothetical protein
LLVVQATATKQNEEALKKGSSSQYSAAEANSNRHATRSPAIVADAGA